MLGVIAGLCGSADEIHVEDTGGENWSCGVASIFGVLRLHNLDVQIADVRRRINEVAPDIDEGEISVAVVRDVVESFGIPASCVVVHRSSWSSVPTPAILYLRPEQVGDTFVGHLILLLRIDSRNATILDLTIGGKERTVALAEAILVGPRADMAREKTMHIRRAAATIGLAMSLCAFVIFYFRRRRWR
jgi:hypothetical protein